MRPPMARQLICHDVSVPPPPNARRPHACPRPLQATWLHQPYAKHCTPRPALPAIGWGPWPSPRFPGSCGARIHPLLPARLRRPRNSYPKQAAAARCCCCCRRRRAARLPLLVVLARRLKRRLSTAAAKPLRQQPTSSPQQALPPTMLSNCQQAYTPLNIHTYAVYPHLANSEPVGAARRGGACSPTHPLPLPSGPHCSLLAAGVANCGGRPFAFSFTAGPYPLARAQSKCRLYMAR